MCALLNFAEAQYQAALLQLDAAKKLIEYAKVSQIPENHARHISNSSLEWIYIDRLVAISGLTHHAIRNRIAKGIWINGVHYRHERNETKRSRIVFNITKINQCLSGIATD